MNTVEIFKRRLWSIGFLCIVLFPLPLSLNHCGFKAPPSPLFDEQERFGEAKDARERRNNQFSSKNDDGSNALKWPGATPSPTPEPEPNIVPLKEPTAR